MRILHFAPKDCLPVNTGAKLRNYYFARELAAKAQVTYLSFTENSPAKPCADADNLEPFAPLESFCERVITLPQTSHYTIGNMVRGLVGRFPLTVLNYTTEAMAKQLEALLEENNFDVVHVESLLLAAYLPIIRAAKNQPLVVCDWHNIDSEVMQRYSQHAPSIARKLYARLTARKLLKLEQEFLEKFDGHFVVSERDRAKLLKISPNSQVFTADNGVDTAFYADEALNKAYASRFNQRSPVQSANQENPVSFSSADALLAPRKRVLFVGSMDYHANVDAVVRFAEDIWPTLTGRFPQLLFTVVGRKPAAAIRALEKLPNLEVTGTVDDVRPFYSEAFVAVVPLRIGGGSRLKILEAMAAGVPVISTRLGAEGLELKDRENFLLAETSADFCKALVELSEETLRQNLIHTARSLVRERYDWAAIGKILFNSYEFLMTGATASTPSLGKVLAEALEVKA
ncbi:MAG: glycosyltransferase [Acidobacteria bacterium]|nr:glycosyltransferase [Acidobacteriota bacterium]